LARVRTRWTQHLSQDRRRQIKARRSNGDGAFDKIKRKRKDGTIVERATKMARLQADASRGIAPSSERMSVASYMQRWLDDAVTSTVRPATRKPYEPSDRPPADGGRCAARAPAPSLRPRGLRAAPWVFPREAGGPQDAQNLMARVFRPLLEEIQTKLDEATAKAGAKPERFPAIRFHDLRHTAASLMLERGLHPKVVSEIHGHATVAMTLEVYSQNPRKTLVLRGFSWLRMLDSNQRPAD
jgi:integrase